MPLPSGKNRRLGQAERCLQTVFVARTLNHTLRKAVGHHATTRIRAAGERRRRGRRLGQTMLVIAVALGRTLR